MDKIEYRRDYYIKNREKILARTNARKKANRQREANYQLKRNYGLTVDQYNAMFEAQKGCCSICGRHQSTLPTRLCVDHNHQTGQVRGLLCPQCNKGLGHFQDSKDLLVNALTYMNKFSNFQNN